MKKVLIINTVGYNYDGITSVILNYLKTMEKEGLSFTFPVYTDIHPNLKEELAALGELVWIPNRKQNVKAYCTQLRQILKNGYDVIHIHGNSGTMLIETLLAKICRVKKIIIHAHSTNTDHPFINAVLKYPMMYLADVRLACSDAAGKWLYGSKKYTVLNNAIDLEKYRFDINARKRYRREFGVGEEYLIGHAGHFSQSKNQSFLIDVFEEVHKQEPKTKLLLVGSGTELEAIEEKVVKKKLTEAVIFIGSRSDIHSIYSAMDMFVLPSKWEGLSLVTVEAQVNGLAVLVSDVVPEETKCSDRVQYKALLDGTMDWAVCIYEMLRTKFDRICDVHIAAAEKGFDIRKEAEKLQKMYIS